MAAPPAAAARPLLPRITIQFCTQCKWMLRAAYYAQELLSTFSLSLAEVALQPSTGGTFVVTIYHQPSPPTLDPAAASSSTPPLPQQSKVLWDRRVNGGFPETKELKRRVRDVVDPARHLGHVDGHVRPAEDSPLVSSGSGTKDSGPDAAAGGGDDCVDCAP